MGDYEKFALGNWELQNGGSLPDAWIAYKTFGDPNSPAIVYPTWYSGSISDNLWLIGEDKALNPKKYFIITPALFGNGESCSPSNHPPARPFPKITIQDNVRAQHKLVTEHFKITHLYAVLGWSMAAAQTYQWATQYPSFLTLALPFCGSARTSLHNAVFLEGQKSYLLAAKHSSSGGSGEDQLDVAGAGADKEKVGGTALREWGEQEREVALKAFGRGYAGWGFSGAWYRARLFEGHYGYEDLEGFLRGFWEGWALSKDPENLLVMLRTWQAADCSLQEPYNGDFEKAMGSIKAKTLVMPCKTDMYFPPEDSEYEVENMEPGVGQLDVIPSIWGHWAGGPGDNLEDVKWLDDRIRGWFEKHGKE